MAFECEGGVYTVTVVDDTGDGPEKAKSWRREGGEKRREKERVEKTPEVRITTGGASQLG
ncbi:hypothetical protein N7539_002030 [Penicillium diatomitis]|uniref:Uncharacterized protein n=1 Tax=Penicillium diatomitis TaxID=2819901 RepID=A0A9X0C0S1_9EURO|nr:uncharacterized protein N7539_002030 [Penicillium diatomitis]KAJ5493284.1 hypothetical protein N7539_002030 [Penicillium diatomitis]